MARAKKIMTAAGTFSAALGIGFIMQYGDALASRFAPEEVVILPEQEKVMEGLTRSMAPELALPTSTNSAALVSMPKAFSPPPDARETVQLAAVLESETSMDLPRFNAPKFGQETNKTDIVVPVLADQEVEIAAIEIAPDPLEVSPIPTPVGVPEIVAAPDCTVRMEGAAIEMAMVALDIAAPCHTNASFVVHHQGMMFTALTDNDGNAELTVPGLSEDAFFIAAFNDGEGAVVQLPLPEMANYDRAVLQWQGRIDVQLHALEFGAGYEDEGHIWNASVGSAENLKTGTGGFLTSLGAEEADNALMAEVYTFPTGLAAREGKVVLNVEAEVTTANCGRDVAAQTIQIAPGQDTAAVDLSLSMPGCEAVGEYLVLKKMLKDLTLAAK